MSRQSSGSDSLVVVPRNTTSMFINHGVGYRRKDSPTVLQDWTPSSASKWYWRRPEDKVDSDVLTYIFSWMCTLRWLCVAGFSDLCRSEVELSGGKWSWFLEHEDRCEDTRHFSMYWGSVPPIFLFATGTPAGPVGMLELLSMKDWSQFFQYIPPAARKRMDAIFLLFSSKG